MKSGYCSALIDLKVYVSLKKKEANVKLDINRGDLCFFSKIKIQGLKDINKSIVSSKIFIKEGDIYDVDLIKNSYKSLYNLDTFDNVYISHNRKIYNKIPIDILLTEISDNVNQSYGIAYSSKLSVQLKFYYEYKNYKGNAKKISFKILFSQKIQEIENKFYAPSYFHFKHYYIDILNKINYKKEQNIFKYDEDSFSNKISFSLSNINLKTSLGLGIEYIDLIKSSNQNRNNFLILYPFFNIIYDLRDSKVNPKNGYYMSSNFEYGIRYNSHSAVYLKNITEARAIKTINNITYSIVGKIGSINFTNKFFPESKKFFAGGSYSNRAYRFGQLGVIEKDGSITEDGAYLFRNINLEMNFSIYKNIKGAIFCDNTLLLSRFNASELIKFNTNNIYTLGVGLRYLTPIAPFKIDIGVNVNKVKDYSLLFQIGQSF